VDGVLNLDKPTGMTSHDVVARVRRVLQTKRAGHAGTLDPDATGVLVVAVGQATRLLPFLPLEPKEYVARLVLGAATDTEDASGRVVAEADASHLTPADLDAVLPRFTGDLEQVPPMVSAVHHQGRRLYELAREGKVVDREPRRVVIHRVTREEEGGGGVPAAMPAATWEATLRVVCGGGTYIRTLCADIGAALGVPAHMKALVREAIGPFARAAALPLSRLEGEARAHLLPMERALRLPVCTIRDEDVAPLGQGRAIAAPGGGTPPGPGDAVALHTPDGKLRALARMDGDGALRPFKVFSAPGTPS
jgi:tRNA pseudouridine55 synthase